MNARTERRGHRQSLLSLGAEVALRAASMAAKKIHGVKIQMAVEKYGIPLAIDVAPA